jgi:Fungal trichothecene efflux pump (TRI12)
MILTFNTGGMTLSGVGAGIEELTALAATSEMAPTKKRGTYVAILIFSIVPFCPSILWGNLIAYHSNWRYCSLICGVWCAIGFVMTAVFYFPPPRPNSSGLSRREVLSQIDWIGGFLSVVGMILFMAGLQWGGYQYDWNSAHVLGTLIPGAILLISFVFWEIYGAKFPMFPAGLLENPRVMLLTLIITFISGANFFSILMFWPTQAYNVYGHEPIGVGVRGLPVGFGILLGACIVLYLLTITRGHIRWLMVGSAVMMVLGCGLMSIATADNLHVLWGPLIVGSLGIGGIIVPASIITTIVCPDDLIATVAALTLSIRVIGGVIGYTTYYNVFINKVTPIFAKKMATNLVYKARLTSIPLITQVILLTSTSLTEDILHLKGIDGNVTKYDIIIKLGQEAYAEGYVWVYYTSIAFGGVAIIASLFLGKYVSPFILSPGGRTSANSCSAVLPNTWTITLPSLFIRRIRKQIVRIRLGCYGRMVSTTYGAEGDFGVILSHYGFYTYQNSISCITWVT